MGARANMPAEAVPVWQVCPFVSLAAKTITPRHLRCRRIWTSIGSGRWSTSWAEHEEHDVYIYPIYPYRYYTQHHIEISICWSSLFFFSIDSRPFHLALTDTFPSCCWWSPRRCRHQRRSTRTRRTSPRRFSSLESGGVDDMSGEVVVGMNWYDGISIRVPILLPQIGRDTCRDWVKMIDARFQPKAMWWV